MSNTIISTNVKILQTIKSHTSDINCVEFYGSSLLVTGSSDKSVRVWRWSAGSGFVQESFSPLIGHKYSVTCVRISPKGAVLASGSIDGTVVLWNISTGDKTDVLLQEGGESVRSLSFSPNGSIIVSSDDSGTVCVWNQQKYLKRLIRCHEESVPTVCFSDDSVLLLTACTLGNIRLYNVSDNFEAEKILADCSIDSAHDMGVLSADFCKYFHSDPSHSNTTIYTLASCGTDHLIKLWRIYVVNKKNAEADSSSTKSRLVPPGPLEHISGSASIFCTSKMNAQCVLTISAHGSSVTCVRFNSSGTLLLSSSLDKTIKIWDLQGNCLKTLLDHTRYVNCVAFNSDSSVIASGSNDRSVIIWDLTNSFTIDSHISGARSLLYTLASNQYDVPHDYICPITHEIMRDPVLAEDGFTYERSAIQEWFGQRNETISPMTNMEILPDLIENVVLKERIDNYLKSLDFDTFE